MPWKQSETRITYLGEGEGSYRRQSGQIRIIETARRMRRVPRGDPVRDSLGLGRPVGSGECEPVIRASVQRVQLRNGREKKDDHPGPGLRTLVTLQWPLDFNEMGGGGVPGRGRPYLLRTYSSQMGRDLHTPLGDRQFSNGVSPFFSLLTHPLRSFPKLPRRCTLTNAGRPFPRWQKTFLAVPPAEIDAGTGAAGPLRVDRWLDFLGCFAIGSSSVRLDEFYECIHCAVGIGQLSLELPDVAE